MCDKPGTSGNAFMAEDTQRMLVLESEAEADDPRVAQPVQNVPLALCL